MEKKTNIRLYFCIGAFAFCFCLILIKAAYLQIINRDKFMSYSENQTIRKTTIYPNRGSILDRLGRPLAINVKTYNVFTMPKNLENLRQSIKTLSNIIPEISYTDTVRKVKKRMKHTFLARKIELNKEQKAEIKKIKGIYLEETTKRYYPNKNLLSHVLGFVGVDNKGLAGIEHYFDDFLRGVPKKIKYIRDAKGRAIKFESLQRGEDSQNVILSIDKNIQSIAEISLKKAVENAGAKKGGVGVINAKTGEILAIANYPAFDPNNFKETERAHRRPSFISDPFEPGSVLKPMTVLAALENSIITTDSNYFCERGRFRVENHIITEADKRKGHEWLSVEDIIKLSSNIGTTKIAFDLSYPRLNAFFDKLGLGRKTEIELSGESRGIFPNEKNVSPLTLSNVSFGQGISVTGIQVLKAFAPLANGGFEVQPTLLKLRRKEVKGKKLIDSQNVNDITKMMVKVVEEGTGTRVKTKYFKIAGKTGTAQKSSPSGGYKGYISSFVGYPVNVKNPFVVFVYIDEPDTSKSYYGGSVAGPAFKDIAEYLLFKNKEFNNFAKINEDKEDFRLDHVSYSSSSVKRDYDASKVPSFFGLDKKSAFNLAKKYNIKLKTIGAGLVVEQSPRQGEDKINDTVTLTFKSPEL